MPNQMTRRSFLQSSSAIALAGAFGVNTAFAADSKGGSTMPNGFSTGADIKKAEAEGEVLFYTADSNAAAAAVCAAFQHDFPAIRANYISAQTGTLYTRVSSERSAKRYYADVVQFSDVGTAIDFQKQEGYAQYQSPQQDAYPSKYFSQPAGYFFPIAVTVAGVSYNTDAVSAAEAPKDWPDLLNDRWKNKISVKLANSGVQFIVWYELRKLFGNDYWVKFAKLNPKGFNSRVQLYERLAAGNDQICSEAEWAGYALQKRKSNNIAYVAPTSGMPTSVFACGLANDAPHPEAAKLFLDWLLSLKGQAFYQQNQYLLYGSLRNDAPPMSSDFRLSDHKLLVPSDTTQLMASRDEFNTFWNKMLGL